MSTPSDRRDPALAPVVQSADEIPAVSHAEMNAAYERGDAVFLSRSISWVMRYRDAWWVVFDHGWLCIVEGLVDPDLGAITARLTAAEQIADAARELEELWQRHG